MIDLSAVWRKAFAPPDRRSIEDWAHENVRLPPVLAKRGRFTIEDSRHFAAPLAALRHDRVRGVRIVAPVRGGKTLIADIFAPWVIVNDSASVLWVFQDDKIAEAHAETRQMPILLSVPAIRQMLPADRHKRRKADILFANGLPFVMQGPALGGLQSRGFKVVICDEPWLYKPGTLGQAKSRLGDFVKTASSKFLAIAQGGDEQSDWAMEVAAGVLFTFHVKCQGCGRLVAPEWTFRLPDKTFAGAVYDSIKLADGTYDKDACAKTVRFVCPHCRHEHPNREKTRSEWRKTGQYLDAQGIAFDPANPPSEVSFRWHALVDYPWEELVKEWLAAQDAKRVGNFAPLVNFFQKRCALMRSELSVHETDLPFATAQATASDPKAKIWDGERARFLTADRQSEDVYWVTVHAWGDGETRRIWFGRLYSEADIESKRIELGVNADCTVIDSGYRPKGDHGVYAACIRYGWIAAKGTDEAFFWHAVQQGPVNGVPQPPQRVQRPWAPLSYGDPGEGTTKEGQTRAPLIRFSAPAMAERVMAMIERGLWTVVENIPADMEAEYKRQMSAEFKRPKVNKFTGRREMVWVCPSGNNHGFDCSKMQVLCAMQVGLLPAGIELQHANDKENSDT